MTDGVTTVFRKSLAIAAVAAAAATVAQPVSAQSRDQIRIVGSSTVYPFASTVVEHFGRESGFKTPVIESTGSGGGLKLFCAGIGVRHPDIANASRRIKPSEVQRCMDNGIREITEVKIGADGIVIANAAEAERIDLTPAQLWQALAAKVPQDGELVANPHRTWSDIDPSLPDQDIEVLGPPPTSGTRDAFNELAMEAGCHAFAAVTRLPEDERARTCLTYRSDGAWIEAGENDVLIVQKLTANRTAVGIFGYSFLEQNRDKIQAARVNGVAPTTESISAGDYPLSRSLWFYVKNAHAEVIPGVKAYIAEFTSESAWGPNGYLVEKGLIPLPEAERIKWKERARGLEPLDPEDIMG